MPMPFNSSLQRVMSLWRQGQIPARYERPVSLGLLAAATSLNDLETLDELLQQQTCLTLREEEEVLLQCLLFTGFPKTIEALTRLRQRAPFSAAVSPSMATGSGAGERACRSIYGDRYDRLIEVLDRLHPDLTDWILEDGYGRVLSRPGLALPDREYCVLVSLMATGMHRQFKAHVQGALNLGIRAHDILWYTNAFKPIIPPGDETEFEKIRDDFQRLNATHS